MSQDLTFVATWAPGCDAEFCTYQLSDHEFGFIIDPMIPYGAARDRQRKKAIAACDALISDAIKQRAA